MTRRLVLRLLQVCLAPLVALAWLESALGRGERCFAACGELLALAPGLPGSLLRTAFYAATIRRCATRSYIAFGALLVHRASSIGENVYVGPYAVVGSATLEPGVRLATRVSVPSGRRQHDASAGDPIVPAHLEPVTIGAGSWVGEGAIVMADVGRGCTVGAGAVVVRPVADGQTVVGNPARPVGTTGEPPLHARAGGRGGA